MASLSHSLASWSALSDSVASLSCSCSRSMPIMSCLREEWLAESAMPVPATNIVTNKNLPPNRVACIIPPPLSSSFPHDCALRRQRTEKVTRQPSLIEECGAHVLSIRSSWRAHARQLDPISKQHLARCCVRDIAVPQRRRQTLVTAMPVYAVWPLELSRLNGNLRPLPHKLRGASNRKTSGAILVPALFFDESRRSR